MAGWYRRFIIDYATVTFAMTELLSKGKRFIWTDDAQKSFEIVKEKLTSAPSLVHANFNKPFILQRDASTCGIGAVLAQQYDDGNERPISFMSQKLNKAQRNYSITELECLAVILAIKKFRSYIEGHEFRVITDHASLKWLMRQKNLSGRLARWGLKLQAFVFSIEHRKGKDNVVPDVLSRSFDEDMNVAEVTLEKLPVIDLNSNAFESKEYCRLRKEFSESNLPDFRVINKFIYKRTKFSGGNRDESDNWKLLVPEEFRRGVIYAVHDIPNAAHGGIAKTIHRIRQFFIGPN